MTSGLDKLPLLKNAIKDIIPGAVYHYFRIVKKDRYIIWAEDDDGGSLNANNKTMYQAIHGTIDLFTKDEYDSAVGQIQDALNDLEWLNWRLNSVQYENETNYTHYEWEFNCW